MMVYLFAQIWLVITSLTKVTLIEAASEQLSETITRLVSGAGTSDAQVTVIGPGGVIAGTVLSVTTIVCCIVE